MYILHAQPSKIICEHRKSGETNPYQAAEQTYRFIIMQGVDIFCIHQNLIPFFLPEVHCPINNLNVRIKNKRIHGIVRLLLIRLINQTYSVASVPALTLCSWIFRFILGQLDSLLYSAHVITWMVLYPRDSRRRPCCLSSVILQVARCFHFF